MFLQIVPLGIPFCLTLRVLFLNQHMNIVTSETGRLTYDKIPGVF